MIRLIGQEMTDLKRQFIPFVVPKVEHGGYSCRCRWHTGSLGSIRERRREGLWASIFTVVSMGKE